MQYLETSKLHLGTTQFLWFNILSCSYGKIGWHFLNISISMHKIHRQTFYCYTTLWKQWLGKYGTQSHKLAYAQDFTGNISIHHFILTVVIYLHLAILEKFCLMIERLHAASSIVILMITNVYDSILVSSSNSVYSFTSVKC